MFVKVAQLGVEGEEKLDFHELLSFHLIYANPLTRNFYPFSVRRGIGHHTRRRAYELRTNTYTSQIPRAKYEIYSPLDPTSLNYVNKEEFTLTIMARQ